MEPETSRIMNNNNSELNSTAKERLADQLKGFLQNAQFDNDHRFIRIQVSVGRLDILQWLREQSFEIKSFWRDREGKFEMAGLGEADVISGSLMPDYHALFLRLKEYLTDTTEDVRYYGGMRFNRRHNSDFKWQAFTSYRFIVPKFEIIRKSKMNRDFFFIILISIVHKMIFFIYLMNIYKGKKYEIYCLNKKKVT